MSSIRHRLIDGKVVSFYKTVVHRFTIPDTEFATNSESQLAEWRSSTPGQFVAEHSTECPELHQFRNVNNFSYDFAIVAELEQSKLSEFYLRFDNKDQI